MKNSLILLLAFFLFQSVYGQYPPNTVWEPVFPELVSPPGYLESNIEDDVRITCISDPDEFGVPAGNSELKGPYAKIQAWNADMSKIALGFRMILNANDYSIFSDITDIYPGTFNEGRWSNTDPDIRYFCRENMFLQYNIATSTVDTLEIFPDYVTATIGPWEGNLSADDRYVVITTDDGLHAKLYDIDNDEVLAEKNFNGAGFDWASMTPSGDYIAIANLESDHLELYDLNFNFIRIISFTTPHGDFAVDTDGNEVFVQVIPLQMVRLDNGVATDLISSALVCGNSTFDPNVAGHVSGRNFGMPGWAYVSTAAEACSNDLGYYYATETFAVKLDGSGIIRKYGHSHTISSVATASPDGTKVLFSSDWNIFESTDRLAYITAYNLEIIVDAKAFLQGSYDADVMSMSDELRASGNIPLTEPFTDLDFVHVSGGAETTTQEVLDVEGDNAIVDWIFVELRDADYPESILATQSALLQRDGNIVSTDGVSKVSFFGVVTPEVFVVLRHRNHFGVRTANAYSTDAPIVVDFSNPMVQVFGQDPMIEIGGTRVMISGDANNDGQVNTTDKNEHWRPENGVPFNYMDAKADFNLDGTINAVDVNDIWRINNSREEDLD